MASAKANASALMVVPHVVVAGRFGVITLGCKPALKYRLQGGNRACVAVCVLLIPFHVDVRATPNDPKLSDGGAWRGSCEGGAQREATDVGQRHGRTRRVRARTAATVTRGAVRCSAWLGVCSALLEAWQKV